MLITRKKCIRYLCSLLFILPCIVYATPPYQLYRVKEALVRYHNSGQYQKDLAAKDELALHYIKKRYAENKLLTHPKKLAVVFDIDETTLSNYRHMVKMQFGGSYHQIMQAVAKGDDPAIKPSLKVYRYAIKHNIAVFFVTGRSEKYRAITIQNLKKAGYTQWTGLYFEPNHVKYASAILYKAPVRKHIEQQGFDIIASIGDQYSDLKGGYDDKGFKLPNPYYHIP